MLSPADLERHAALGITADLLERMHVRRVTDREAREALALNGSRVASTGCCIRISIPNITSPVTHRLRRDHPEFEAGKPKNKYVSGYGDHRHLYFGDVARRDADRRRHLGRHRRGREIRPGRAERGRPARPPGARRRAGRLLGLAGQDRHWSRPRRAAGPWKWDRSPTSTRFGGPTAMSCSRSMRMRPPNRRCKPPAAG